MTIEKLNNKLSETKQLILGIPCVDFWPNIAQYKQTYFPRNPRFPNDCPKNI